MAPAMLAPMVFLFILPFPGTVALRLVALAVAIVTAAWRWRALDVPPFPCKAAIGFWAAVAAFSLVYAADPTYTLGEIKNEVGYSLLAFASLFALTRDQARLRWASLSVSAALLVIAGAAAVTYRWTGGWALEPWYGGPPSTTNYVMMAAPVAGLCAFLWWPRRAEWICWVLVGVDAMIGILASERAIWPALGIQGVVILCWLWRRRQLRLPSWKLAFVAGVVLTLSLGGLLATEWQRRHTDPDAAIEKDLRFSVWQSALERVLASPLTGAGLGRQAFNKAYPELVPPENRFFWHTHNMVVNYAVSAGLPGMAAIVALFCALGWRFARLARSANPALAAVGLTGLLMVVGVFSRNMFNDFFVRDGALLFWALCGALLGYALREERKEANRDAGLASR